MSRRKTYGFSFSWKRALGISALRGKIARALGIPTTKTGLQRKLGRSALGIGAGIVAGAAAATANQGTNSQAITQQRISQPRKKKKSSSTRVIAGISATIIGIVVCSSYISLAIGGGNTTPTPTRKVQPLVLNPISTQIPTNTFTYTFTITIEPTITSTPYPPGFRPTDTRWPTITVIDISPTPKPFPTGTKYLSPTPRPYLPLPTSKPYVPPPAPTVPNGGGPTALCNDGTYSYAAHHQGACSHHGGVAVWYK